MSESKLNSVGTGTGTGTGTGAGTSAVAGKAPAVVKAIIEAENGPVVELHLEGEDDYGLHLRDHRLHINGGGSLLSDVK